MPNISQKPHNTMMRELKNTMLRDMTEVALSVRQRSNIIPPVTKDSFRHPFGSPEFYEDGEITAQIGEEGEVVKDKNEQNRFVIFNYADGTSFAPSVK